MDPEIPKLRDILKNNQEQLLDRKNVVATGIGYKITGDQKTATLSIVCSVTEKVEASKLMERDLVPESVGLGKDKDGHMAIIVGLDRARPDIEDQLPRHLESHPVIVQVVGSIKARR